MGKASRLKKERKEQASASVDGGANRKHGKPKAQASSNVHSGLEALNARLGGGDLIVIDGNGVVRGEEARQMYWSEVCEGIRSHGASCLPAMADLGRLMKLSIFDVKVPVVEYETGTQNYEDIFSAMFLFGDLDCFQWLLGEARRSPCDWVLLGKVFRNIVGNSSRLEEESPHMAMAKMMVRFMAESFHSAGVLEEAIADGTKTMGQPFARRIAQDYLEEIASKSERSELDSVIAVGERAIEVGAMRI